MTDAVFEMVEVPAVVFAYIRPLPDDDELNFKAVLERPADLMGQTWERKGSTRHAAKYRLIDDLHAHGYDGDIQFVPFFEPASWPRSKYAPKTKRHGSRWCQKTMFIRCINVWRLRRQGLTYKEIGTRHGIGTSFVRDIVVRIERCGGFDKWYTGQKARPAIKKRSVSLPTLVRGESKVPIVNMRPRYIKAMKVGKDAGNASAKEAGRKHWSEDDWNEAAAVVTKLMKKEG